MHILKATFPLLILGLSYYFYLSYLQVADSPIIETLTGSIKGITSISRNGRMFFEYLGIPFAKPPVGDLRFEAPQLAEKWSGIRDSGSYGLVCLQTDLANRMIHGSEDCLTLNVFVPKSRNGSRLLPIIAWIHGGMFAFGSSRIYGPGYWMDSEVIMVTINYRLGSLGFLSTGDHVVRGNMGLLDQNMALRWIQSNIKFFGGDPDRVTILGHSAGGISASFHILSPLSKGLFHKVIMMSGNALAKWSYRTNPKEQAQLLSQRLGCPTLDSESMIMCLKAIDRVKLMEPTYSDLENDYRDPITIFSPTIEVIKEGAFIAESPLKTLLDGNFNKVPSIIGITDMEGLVSSAPLERDSKFLEISQNFDTLFPRLIWMNGELNKGRLNQIKNFYFGNQNQNFSGNFQNWTNIFTDSLFASPAQRYIRIQSEITPVYAYFYSFKGEFALADFLFAISGKRSAVTEYLTFFMPRWYDEYVRGIKPTHLGASHFDEIALLFSFGLLYIRPTHKDYEMSRKMIDSFVSFATYSPSVSPQFDGIPWPIANARVKQGKPLQYMQMDVESRIIDEPNSERNKFWNSLGHTIDLPTLPRN